MKNFIIAFSIFTIWALFALWLYSWLVPMNNLALAVDDSTKVASETVPFKNIDTSIKDTAVITSTQTTASPLSYEIDSISIDTVSEIPSMGLNARNDSNDIIFMFEDGISFKKNNDTVLIDQSLIDFKYKVNTYLLEHPDQEVHINSLYSADENIVNPNLGTQRGLKIKNILIDAGIASEKIVVKSIIKSLEFNQDTIFENAIDFSFEPLNEERIEKIEVKKPIIEIPESITFYPGYSEDGVLANKKLEQITAEIKEIFAQKPDVQITIIGHTDNLDNAIENYRMGLVYGREIRLFLIKNGNIDPKNISAISRGEAQPVRSNKTIAGRKANKRIEINFQ